MVVQKSHAAEQVSVQGQPGLQTKFQDSQGYKVRQCLKTKNKTDKAVKQSQRNGSVGKGPGQTSLKTRV